MTSTSLDDPLPINDPSGGERSPLSLKNPVLDIVIPVYNEEQAIQQAVETIRSFVDGWTGAPTFRITIADNASIDRTLDIAQSLATQDPRIRVVHFDEKGRGRALKATWLASDADIVMYMDVDLATDLSALPSLVTPLLTGVAHVAIGTRLHRYSRVVRGPRREFISRTYNRIIRASTGARFSDAQCGFKAITREAAHTLLPHVSDKVWFFDTELLLLADYCGLHIAEIPVDWVDDPSSSVNITNTALEDLRGIGRVLRSRMRREYPREEIHRALVHPLRSQVGREVNYSGTLRQQIVVFGVIGVLSTILQAVLYLGLKQVSGEFISTVVSLVLATLFNTAVNRTFTFGVRDRASLGKHHVQNLLITAATALVQWMGVSWLAHSGGGSTAETAWIAISGILIGVLRFVAMKWWMFRAHQ